MFLIQQIMHKQPLSAASFTPARAKLSKSNAKTIVKQSLHKLQTLYSQFATPQHSSHSTLHGHLSNHTLMQRAAYLQVIDSTYQICLNLDTCSNNVRKAIDLGDIIGNNFVLGLKTSNDFMVGGFVYLAAKYLNEGSDYITLHLNKLKNMVHQESTPTQTTNSIIVNELRLAFQNIPALIIPSLNSSIKNQNNKIQNLIENAVNCLSKIIELRFQTKLRKDEFGVDPQECFYHVSLRAAKICKLNKRNTIYKQLLASYFRYISQQRVMPTLDLCKLLLDSIVEDGQTLSNSVMSSLTDSARITGRDEELTGFLVRKCFNLIYQNYERGGFYIEEDTLRQAVHACFTVQPYCHNVKNIAQIVQTLFKMKKLNLITDDEYWATEPPISNAQQESKAKKQSNLLFIKACKYICSCSLYMQQVVSEFQSQSPKSRHSQNLPYFSAQLQQNIGNLLNVQQPIIIHIWYHIINCLHSIKSEVFTKCNRKVALQHRGYIVKWAVCAQIQDIIITHPKHKSATDNGYVKYELSNMYILTMRQYLREGAIIRKQNRRMKLGQKQMSMSDDSEIGKLMSRFEEPNNVGAYKYWDDLISFGALLMENCADSDSLERVATILKALLKNKLMIQYAHHLHPSPIAKETKYQKLSGLCNLLISFQRWDHKERPNAVDQYKLTKTMSQNQDKNKLTYTKSGLNQLRRHQQKIRGQLLFCIFKDVIQYMTQNIISKVKQSENQKHSANEVKNFPYEDVMGYALALVPLVQNQLNFQDRVVITKLRSYLIESLEFRSLHKCRYIYHKTVAMLLQDYANINTTQQTEAAQKQHQAKCKKVLTTYLQSYISLYPKQISCSFANKSKVSPQQMRRRSVKQRESLRKFELKQGEKENCKWVDDEYSKILYIDFVQWVIMYCRKKQMNDIREVADDVMDVWLDGKSLEEYLFTLISYLSDPVVPNVIDFQLLAECTNKLIYLRSNVPKEISATGQTSVSEDEGESSRSSINSPKINIEFEFQQASLHIGHLSKIIKMFAQVCYRLGKPSLSCETNWIEAFMDSDWQRPHIDGLIGCREIRNYGRLVTCLNNLMGIASNIGYKWSTQQQSVMGSLCTCKLILSQKHETDLELYSKYSQMVFLGYLPKSSSKNKQIEQRIALISEGSKTVHKYDTKNNIENQSAKLYQNNLCLLIKLYLGLFSLNQQIRLPVTQNQHLLNLLFAVQSIQHMHPHKSLLRSISGYIFTQRFLNEESLLKYNQSLLPLTNCTLINNTNDQNHKSLMDYSSNQIEHKLLQLILTRLLNCLLMNNQVSQFRSILRLALVYFLRSRNIAGILLALHCYLTRIKHIPVHHSQSQHRKSQLQPIPSSQNQQNPVADNFPPLDMLLISDSFCSVLSALYGDKFDAKSYDKFSKAVLQTGNRRRTSASFHICIESVLKSLASSIGKCGQTGHDIYVILSDYTCKSFECRKYCVGYAEYLKLKNYSYEQASQSYNKAADSDLRNLIDRKLSNLFKRIQQKLNNFSLNEEVSQEIQELILKQLKGTVMFSYQHALILQNLMEFAHTGRGNENMVMKDKIIIELSLLMLDQNFKYKRMVESIEPVTINHGTDDDFRQLVCSISRANKNYQAYISSYISSHQVNLEHLLSSNVPYPLTILYPFASKLYAIAFQKSLLIATTDLLQFEEHINTVDTLIAKNSKLLNDKNVDPKQWWKSRDRVDRSIGKIVQEIGIWGWDTHLPDELSFGLAEEERRVYKLVFILLSISVNDLKKIKTLMLQTNIKNHKYPIEDIILKVTRFLSEKSNFYQMNSSKIMQQSQNLLLLIHPQHSMFPFEANSYLSRERAVFRIPSIQYMIENTARGRKSVRFNISKTNFLVNSANDLIDTQKNFYRIKENFPKWQGIVGRKPSIKQFLNLLCSDIFLYMGHGSGSSHLRERQFYNKTIQCLMMLFGCSSAAMTLGKVEPNGFAHSNLINGSPGVLGCLWQVTDKDTDKVTESIFKNLTSQPQNLQRILGNSKKKCKHQFLNGGALVIFGMPAYIYCD